MKKLILCLIVGVVFVLNVYSEDNAKDYSNVRALIKNELKFAKSSTYVLGKELAEMMPGAKVLIISEQNEGGRRLKAQIEGLKEGFGKAITDITIAFPQRKQDDASRKGMPIMVPIQAADFNAFIKKHNKCNLIVTMIGLPDDLDKITLWKEFNSNPEKSPKLAIAFGDISRLRRYIKTGSIITALSYNPTARFTADPAPEDMRKAFNKRYLIISKNNLLEITNKYKGRIFTDEKAKKKSGHFKALFK